MYICTCVHVGASFRGLRASARSASLSVTLSVHYIRGVCRDSQPENCLLTFQPPSWLSFANERQLARGTNDDRYI